ncbi:MAG: hypothetical protein ACRDQ9_20610, partial [Pseudonocardiaceae bacterium]
AEHLLDRMVSNIEHGRFERSLSGLTAYSYNLPTGPPISAPGLMAMAGGMGLLAALLRREK